MTRWATLLAILVAPCSEEPKAAAPAPASQSCLDRELARRGLNPYGDPPDTVYPGGTPLFDEKTGRSTPRERYVLDRHPEIARACGGDAGP